MRLALHVFLYWKVFASSYFPSTAATIQKEILKEGFLRSFFSEFALPVIGNYNPFSLQILCRKYESWLKLHLQKSLFVSIYICL